MKLTLCGSTDSRTFTMLRSALNCAQNAGTRDSRTCRRGIVVRAKIGLPLRDPVQKAV